MRLTLGVFPKLFLQPRSRRALALTTMFIAPHPTRPSGTRSGASAVIVILLLLLDRTAVRIIPRRTPPADLVLIVPERIARLMMSPSRSTRLV